MARIAGGTGRSRTGYTPPVTPRAPLPPRPTYVAPTPAPVERAPLPSRPTYVAPTPAPAQTPIQQAAANLAQTFTHEEFRLGQVDRTTTTPEQQYSIFGEPIDLQGPIGFSFADVPSGQEPYQDERQYDLSGRFGTSTTGEAQTASLGFVRRPVEPVTTSSFATSAYQGPTGQVGPNEIVVENLADVALTRYQNPDANIFYADPITGELTAKAGIMAFVPALNQYLAGEDIPDSVVQSLIDLGLLTDTGAATAVGGSLSSGSSSVAKRTSYLTGSPARFSGTSGASRGLISWRIGF